MTKQVPLSNLAPGQKGTIIAIRSRGPLRRRLLDMGMVRGETVYVERVAPLGDPVEYSVKGAHLSLRRRDAANIIVEVPSQEDEDHD
ncbi:MAG: ferrous iron transport protein A [Chloroflexi bacterium]|nr:ferrous iron transport protein A [Chloroflexota bacterium]